jgi:hypothetical protein
MTPPLLLLALLVANAVQDPPPSDADEVRDLARASLELSRAVPQQLRLERLAAVRGESEARFRDFLGGYGTLDLLLASSRDWRDAERLLAEGPAEWVAALERYWETAWLVEVVNQRRHEDGRIPTKEYDYARFLRLGAEIDLLQAVAGDAKVLRLGWRVPPPVGRDDEEPYLKGVVRAKFAALRANPAKLAGERLHLIQKVWDSRYRQFLAGQGTLDILLDVSRERLQVERESDNRPEARAAACERHWEVAWCVNDANRLRYEAGRIPEQDYLMTRHALAEATIWLIEARAKSSPPLSLEGRSDTLFPDAAGRGDERRQKELARAKLAAVREASNELARLKREAARRELLLRWDEFVKGTGSQHLLLETSWRRLEADLAAAGGPAERVAARERHWRLTVRIDRLSGLRYDARRIPVQDHLQARHARLEAALGLLSAQAVR